MFPDSMKYVYESLFIYRIFYLTTGHQNNLPLLSWRESGFNIDYVDKNIEKSL